MTTAAERWATELGGWGIPDEIVAAAPVSPWSHEVATFSVDDTLDRDNTSARVAREVLPPRSGVVLDVGCGGGRSSAVLVPPATALIGVDQSETMLAAFAEMAASAGVAFQTVHGSWPDVAPATPPADVVICHHVFFNVADAVPFATALTDHARLAVVVEIPVRHPLSGWNAAWKHFWDLDRPAGPTDEDLVAVLRETGLVPEIWRGPRAPLSSHASDPSTLLPAARRRLCLPPERDGELAEYLAEHPIDFVRTVTTLRWPGTATTDG
ncbi:MAG: class I SAM-dependent methyltransferase [Ilumatobacteraceae bacterium]